MKTILFLATLALLAAPLASHAEVVARSSEREARSLGLDEFGMQMIMNYTQWGYDINNSLSNVIDDRKELVGPMVATEEPAPELVTYRYAKQLNEALDKIAPYKKPVYRGNYHASDEKLSSRYFTGRVWKERRFTSTTYSKAVAEKFAMGVSKQNDMIDSGPFKPDLRKYVLVTINSRTGRDISKLAPHDEREVLFKSGAIFKCTGVKRDEKKRLFVTIEELDPALMTDADQKALMESEKLRFEKILASSFDGSMEKYEAAAKLWNDAWPSWRAQGLDEKRYEIEDDQAGG